MNVHQELIGVSKFAATPLDLTHATATVGMSLMPMEEHVMVSGGCNALCDSPSGVGHWTVTQMYVLFLSWCMVAFILVAVDYIYPSYYFVWHKLSYLLS